MDDPKTERDTVEISEDRGLLRDHHLPPDLTPPETRTRKLRGVTYRAADWTPHGLAALTAHLAGVGRKADGFETADLEAAWQATVAAYRDPGSPERRRLDPILAPLCRLSPPGLAAGLEAVLGGVAGVSASRLITDAVRTVRHRPAERAPVVVLLASNLPALAVQPLLPALALRRPVLLKSPSSEPLFAPAFLAALTRRAPRLREAVAAVAWRGGDRELEAPVLAAAGRVLAYGEADTVSDVETRAPGKVIAYGPRTSLAVVGCEVDLQPVAEGLARDVALFDQRGCLSVAAIYVAGSGDDAQRRAGKLARLLATELSRYATLWPPGPVDDPTATAALAAVQQTRAEAELRALERPRVADDSVAAGTVVVEPEPAFRPSPGLRTVRVHPLPDLARIPELLSPWRDRLQGVALAGEDAEALNPALTGLGVSRTAPPGELQTPDALWHNGGVHPLMALGADDPSDLDAGAGRASRAG